MNDEEAMAQAKAVFAKLAHQSDSNDMAFAKRIAQDMVTKESPSSWQQLAALINEDGRVCVHLARAMALRYELDMANKVIESLRDRLDDLAAELEKK